MARGHSRRSGYEEETRNIPDISQWLDFELYYLVWWWDRTEMPNVSDDPKRLEREEIMKKGVKRQIEEFSSKLADRLDDSNFTADQKGYLASMDLDEIANLVSNKYVVTCKETTVPDIKEYTGMITEEFPDKDDEEAIDQYLTAELILVLGTDGERVGR
eukprot:13908351-Ditylum_brightwellii.AAC.1